MLETKGVTLPFATMPNLSVVISEQTEKLLQTLSEMTGLTKSSLAAEFIRKGVIDEVSNQKKIYEFTQNVQKPKAKE